MRETQDLPALQARMRLHGGWRNTKLSEDGFRGGRWFGLLHDEPYWGRVRGARYGAQLCAEDDHGWWCHAGWGWPIGHSGTEAEVLAHILVVADVRCM